MKYIIILIILFSINCNGFDLSEPDKQKHLMATSTISGAMYQVMRSNGNSKTKSFLYGLVLSNFVGLMKEYSDPKVDIEDIGANVLGSIIGPSLFIMWEF